MDICMFTERQKEKETGIKKRNGEDFLFFLSFSLFVFIHPDVLLPTQESP